MRALVVGLVSIGKRHLRNLRTTVPEVEITVWRQYGRSENDAEFNPQANRFVYSLEDGLKIYAFHTLNMHARACTQTIATDKSYETVRTHCLHTWKTLGIQHFLQLDNNAVFCGSYKAPRTFGQFVRLCLYLGIELIFLPIAQPEHNREVEELNGLWRHAFWERRHFTSFAQVGRTSPVFIHWYMTEYVPPFLIDITPKQAQGREILHRLPAKHVLSLPNPLPITLGRIHFIRQVQSDGTIPILNGPRKIGKRLAGKYLFGQRS